MKHGLSSFSLWMENGRERNASMGIPGGRGSIPVLCPVLPITSAATPTRPPSTCSQTGGQDITLTCPLDRSLAPGRCCPSWLSCWPLSGGMTLTVGWGSLARSPSLCPSLTSDPNISTPETGIKTSSPWTRTTACEEKFKYDQSPFTRSKKVFIAYPTLGAHLLGMTFERPTPSK